MRQLAGLSALLFGLLFLPAFAGTLTLRTAIEILYFGLFATAFNLLFTHGGMLSFGFNASFAASAYAFALFTNYAPSLSPPFAIVLAIAGGGFISAFIGGFCVRLNVGYFSLLTLAFAQFLYAIALKWRSVTKGEDGLIVRPPSIDLPFFGSADLGSIPTLYYVTLAIVCICLLLNWMFMRTPLGFSIILCKENEERAKFLGYNTYLFKLAVFTVSGTFAGVAGIVFAIFQKLVSPDLFGLGPAGDVLMVTILGGSGTYFGPMIGAVTYHFLQDFLSRTTEHWRLFVGLLFVFVILFAPDGIAGSLARLRRQFARSSAKAEARQCKV
jgi:branched-chain amino acid transport system permease protein